MSRPPPTSTLFPYTTLFRSGHIATARNIPVAELESRLGELAGLERGLIVLACRTDKRSAMAARTLRAAGLDRKSTRLNSSHVAISYAVFCLKKKKKQQNTRY